MTDVILYSKAESVLQFLRAQSQTVALAESCTGGLVAATLTEIPGASDIVRAGFIVYSVAAKIAMLGIDPALLAEYGAVSYKTAEAMALGALAHSDASVSVAITGVAGPGMSEGKEVGLVYIAYASLHSMELSVHVQEHHLSGSRQDIRLAATHIALDLLQKEVHEHYHDPL
jgi:nicotinamide-nucleotide amidase